MSEMNDRREFLKAAAIGAVGVAAGPALLREAAAAEAMSINKSAKAVMPSGEILDRRAILSQLGLDPTTPPDAWLAIVACGSNAAALTDRSKELLMKGGVLKKEMMQKAPISR
jgi:anaerobic selenocysteine-containing dehydrogenase